MFSVIDGHEVWLAHPWLYVFWVTVASVGIRGIMSSVRVIRAKWAKPLWYRWVDDLRDQRYFVPTLVGTLELQVYPILIATGRLQAIGWWLGIKIAGGWRWRMNNNRRGYTNFILGNALVIFASIMLTRLIKR